MKRITATAKELGVCSRSLRQWVRRGQVPVTKTPGNRWFWTDAQIAEIKRSMDVPRGTPSLEPHEPRQEAGGEEVV